VASIGEALSASVDGLRAAGVEDPRLDAEVMLAEAIGCDRATLIASPEAEIAPPATRRFGEMVRRRLRREPVAYILGRKGFRRIELAVDRRVLIPRPETEQVVEVACDELRRLSVVAPPVVDLGTGSGAIALAIADERPDAHVIAVDSSPEAVALARENAERLDLQIEIREGDLEAAAEGWDLVVSNPPYVPADEWESLQPEIRDWEPRNALVGEGIHEEIARLASTRLLVFEVGDGQADHVADALASLGYADITITPDLAEEDRVVEGRR
jgi:release factor glutamine methyltransferase